jgi:ABC-type phosphate transport system substrate-binding protein
MKVFDIALLLATTISPSRSLSQVFELHGSGTSNPSKCFWRIMETLKEQSDVPLHLTYRAMGMAQGIAEFTAQFGSNGDSIVLKFASGDILLSTSDYESILNATSGVSPMYHLPVLVGAIGFFHSIPGYDNLKLNACLLSQIYQLKITKWGDRAIVDLNPDMPAAARNLTIVVARRADGSSTSFSSTEVCIHTHTVLFFTYHRSVFI